MTGRDTARPSLAAWATGLLVLASAAEIVYRGRLPEAVAGTNDLSSGLVISGVEHAVPFLVLAAVLVAGPALGLRHGWLLAGALGLAAGELLSVGTQLWVMDPAFRVSTLEAIESASAVTRVLSTAGAALGLLGWMAMAVGVGAAGRAVGRGWSRLTLAAVAIAAGCASAAGWGVEAWIEPTNVDPLLRVVLGLAVATAIAGALSAAIAILQARPGPPLDWRWPFGIGLGLELAGAATALWLMVASIGGDLVGWIVWSRLISAAGGVVMAAGLWVAAAVRWPAGPNGERA